MHAVSLVCTVPTVTFNEAGWYVSADMVIHSFVAHT